MKLKRIIAVILAISLVVLAGCSSNTSNGQNADQKSTVNEEANGSKKQGGTFIMGVGSEPMVLNPLYGNDRTTITINNSLYAPLFIQVGDELRYYLAESFTPSEEFMTYTLKLKKDLKWHDGESITADDLIFTMDKIMDANQNSFLRDGFMIDNKPVKYKKIDDLTIEFKLPSLTMAFTSAVAQVSPLPKHIFENETDIAMSIKNENPVGSGPFKFKEEKKGETVSLVRFDDYFDGKANLDSIVYRVLPDANASNVALQNGEISVKYVDPKDADKFKNDANLNVFTYNEGMLNSMIFNQNNDNLKRLEVRQAIAYAINKSDIIKAAYISDEFAETAYSVLAPNTLYYTNDVNKFEQNTSKAAELLSKAGITNLKLRFGYMKESKTQEPIVLIIQQNLKDVGIEVELVPMERGAYFKKLMNPKDNKDIDLALNGYVMGNEPDLYRPLFLADNANNYGNFNNPAIDELWNKGTVETDKAKRAEIYKEIQKKLAYELPLYPMIYPKSIIAIDKKIGGIKEAEPTPLLMFRDLSKLYFTE